MARARNEGRLFSRIKWPMDPEVVSYSSCNAYLIYDVFYLLLFFLISDVFYLSNMGNTFLCQREQVKRLHLLLTVKDTAANIPKNLEARRRLEFFSNSLFMDMPSAVPVCQMMPFRFKSYDLSQH